MNHGETLELSSYLRRAGHQQVEDEEGAEVALINTCAVIAPTEKKILRRLKKLQSDGKKLVIVGCMASVDKGELRNEFPGALIYGPSDYSRLPLILEGVFGVDTLPPEEILPVGPLILPIAQGCPGSCTYCITKLARGNLRSYPFNDLVDKARVALSHGVREILITAQDTAAYGMDGSERLPDLMKAVCALPGDFRVRVGMMNPDNLKGIVSNLAEAYKNPKVYRFLHLPVQSGSDRVIRDMGRAYSARDYFGLVAKMRRAVPGLTLCTDVITGFPGEAEEDHRATVALMEELRPNSINITRFSPRPGTVAEGMGLQVPGWVAKERSRELTGLRFRISSQINTSKVGGEYAVLIDEPGKWSSVIARTDDYLPVVIKGDHDLWQRVRVRITAAAPTHLYGTTVSDMEN